MTTYLEDDDGVVIATALAFGEKWDKSPTDVETATKKIKRVADWFQEVTVDSAAILLLCQGKIGISVDDATNELIFHHKPEVESGEIT